MVALWVSDFPDFFGIFPIYLGCFSTSRPINREEQSRKGRRHNPDLGRFGCQSRGLLGAPFLGGLFSRGFSRGKTAHEGVQGNGLFRRGKQPIKEGKRPINANGRFSGTVSVTVENGPSKNAH